MQAHEKCAMIASFMVPIHVSTLKKPSFWRPFTRQIVPVVRMLT